MAALQEVDTNRMDAAAKKKRLSVERIYQKKTQLEHIILRPDSYIGSAEPVTQNMWVWDDANSAIVSKSITYTPGLYKIYDEIIVNAADNKQRDMRMSTIKVTINQESNSISIWNNGKGIPVEMHKEEKVYVPSLIFGHLLTSSNYDDSEKKVVGGRNGFGAKLCNIFSTKFSVETACGGKKFKQVWRNNMAKAETEKIVDFSGTDYTCVTFSPDLAKFKMEKLDDDFVALIKRRAYDMAGVCRGVSVILNGEKIKVKTFKDYVNLYVKGAALSKKNEDAPTPKIVHEIVNPRWEVCVTVSESGFQQASFVNSIATTKGGSHISYLVDQICDKLIATVKKKTGKGGFNIKPFQVKPHLWVFANCLIENPTFDSQTKENMTLRKSAFGSTCELSEKYIKQVQDCGVLENIMNWVKFKSEAQLNKKTLAGKHSRLKGIPKLDDANDAGTKHSKDCTLIVTEGDSAKALAMAGLSVVGRDKYGVFPLKGKLLNVRDASHKQIMDNNEIGHLLKIIGLQFGKKYDSESDMKSLRYGHLMIMADQDIDGSHIKGLVINFVHAHWPGLLKLPFLEEFITPIVKVTKGKQTQSFFSIPEFEEWKGETSNSKSWRIKYYKGLGTSTSKEGKEYFSNMQRHRIVFDYDGPSCDQALVLAFSKKLANDRKDWLNQGMSERKLRREAELPEIYLYEKDTRRVTYRDFVNKELILFSNADNERSIPSLVDGLKPGQRKVLFTCMKRNDKHEVKVAQLAGSVSELSAYHHGEMSLMSTIVNLAQNYVGSNNLNLLVPHGQFGTRHLGGKDSASPRYICTMLSSLTRMVFPVYDDYVLNFLTEDNQRIEPEWYCPIIPMCLINGADGIGTGYSTKVPNHDLREIIDNVRRMINEEEPLPMTPSYKGFTGEITEIEPQKYTCCGNVSILDETTIEISELPIRHWTQSYKESVMDAYLYGTDKVPACITDYKEYHTDTTVRFVVSMTPEQLAKAEQEGLHKKFKLEVPLTCQNLVLFDEYGCVKKYQDAIQIIKEFYDIRLKKYNDRKEFMKGMLEAEASRLENQARFILEKIEGKIVIENRTKRDVVTTLVERGFVSDPVKVWKAKVLKDTVGDDESEAPVTDYASSASTTSGGPDFQYLLSMAIMSLSKEKKDELLRQRDEKKAELERLLMKSPQQLWLDDLDVFCEELEIVEEQERIDDEAAAAIVKKGGRSAQARKGKKVPAKSKDIKKAFEKKPKEPSKAALKKVKDEFGFETDSVKNEEGSTAASSPVEVIDDEPMSLADRLKKKKKQTTLSFKPKKSLLKSDSEDESDDEFKIEDFSDKEINLPKRETRKKPNKKYFVDDDDESKSSEDDDDDDKDDNDNSFKASDDSDNSEVAETRALIERLTPKKQKQSPKKLASPQKDKHTAVEKQSAKKIIFGDSSKEAITIGDSPAKLKKNESKAAKKQPTTKKSAATKSSKKEDPKQKKLSFAGKEQKSKKKSTEEESSDVEMVSPVKMTSSVAKQKKTKSVATKRKPMFESDDDDSDVQKKPPKSAKTKKPESKPKATAGKAKKSRKKFMCSDDDDDDSFHIDEKEPDVPAPTGRERTGRRAVTAKKTYKFSSDEDNDEDDDDFC